MHRSNWSEHVRIVNTLTEACRPEDGDYENDPLEQIRKEAQKLTRCGDSPVIYQNDETGKLSVTAWRCRSRLCPLCQRLTLLSIRDKIADAVKQMDSPRFITLTLQHEQGDLQSQVKKLVKSFAKLRRSKRWKHYVTGGVYTIEINWNAKTKTWHPHLHIIANGTYYPQPMLSADWLKTTGNSQIVDIRAMHDRAKAVTYITSYITKSWKTQPLEVEQLIEWVATVKHQRMWSRFGSIHAAKNDDDETKDAHQRTAIACLDHLISNIGKGDHVAAQLYHDLRTAVCTRIPRDDTRAVEKHLERHRQIARRLRAWKQARIENPDDFNDPATTPTVAKPGTHHREVGLWEDDVGPTRGLASHYSSLAGSALV